MQCQRLSLYLCAKYPPHTPANRSALDWNILTNALPLWFCCYSPTSLSTIGMSMDHQNLPLIWLVNLNDCSCSSQAVLSSIFPARFLSRDCLPCLWSIYLYCWLFLSFSYSFLVSNTFFLKLLCFQWRERFLSWINLSYSSVVFYGVGFVGMCVRLF